MQQSHISKSDSINFLTAEMNNIISNTNVLVGLRLMT